MDTQYAYNSWGRVFHPTHAVYPVYWDQELFEIFRQVRAHGKSMLAHGFGRSYGDSCLNDQGALIVTPPLSKVKFFDAQAGIICCEAGASLSQLLDLIVPRGWFLPVSPGTKFISVGGAVANDVHGKNHHVAGTFGRHIKCFELMRSDGKRLICSPTENSELFAATIGGLGLTGFITWVEFGLIPIESDIMEVCVRKFDSLDEYLRIASEFDRSYTYTVAWIDCLAKGRSLGRGHLIAGEHHPAARGLRRIKGPHLPNVPIDLPNFALNSWTMSWFNQIYYHRMREKVTRFLQPTDSFFYPLDGIGNWNRIYGKRGMRQFQAVISQSKSQALASMLALISRSQTASFLAVLKTFGKLASPGLLSFPAPGFTLSIDFPDYGQRTMKLFRLLEDIVMAHGGRIYPAKDSMLSSDAFKAGYANLPAFVTQVDPGFSSSFWRRVYEGSETKEWKNALKTAS